MFNSHLRESYNTSHQVLKSPTKNDLSKQSEHIVASPPQKNRVFQYSNENVNKMLKAPAKKSVMGLKIQCGNENAQHTRNGSTNISDVS